VAPVGPQLGLGAEQPGAPHDQALLANRRLRDLRLAVGGVVGQRLPVGLIDRGDRGLDVLLLARGLSDEVCVVVVSDRGVVTPWPSETPSP
jgi:hypothetical protein